jgi:hypothetical protein
MTVEWHPTLTLTAEMGLDEYTYGVWLPYVYSNPQRHDSEVANQCGTSPLNSFGASNEKVSSPYVVCKTAQ